jgi:hypothetical protein
MGGGGTARPSIQRGRRARSSGPHVPRAMSAMKTTRRMKRQTAVGLEHPGSRRPRRCAPARERRAPRLQRRGRGAPRGDGRRTGGTARRARRCRSAAPSRRRCVGVVEAERPWRRRHFPQLPQLTQQGLASVDGEGWEGRVGGPEPCPDPRAPDPHAPHPCAPDPRAPCPVTPCLSRLGSPSCSLRCAPPNRQPPQPTPTTAASGMA